MVQRARARSNRGEILKMKNEWKKVVYVDIETGGLDRDRHPITQIAAYVPATKEFFERKIIVDPAECDPVALEINHYNPAVWAATAVPACLAALDFIIFLRRHATIHFVDRDGDKLKSVAQMAGHNADAFDLPFLRRWAAEFGHDLPIYHTSLCTKQLAMWLHPGLDSYSLGPLCQHFGIEIKNAHDALADAVACARLAERLLEIEECCR
jgi:DNA polymerase III epsilon subunit-like protein